jgi:hypothetical protein
MKRPAEDFGMYAIKSPPKFDTSDVLPYGPADYAAEEAAVDAIFGWAKLTRKRFCFGIASRRRKAGWHFACRRVRLGAAWRAPRATKSVPENGRQDDNESLQLRRPWAVDEAPSAQNDAVMTMPRRMKIPLACRRIL